MVLKTEQCFTSAGVIDVTLTSAGEGHAIDIYPVAGGRRYDGKEVEPGAVQRFLRRLEEVVMASD